MNRESIGRYLKAKYDEYEPFWKWRVPIGKKVGGSYNQVLAACRASQYPVAAVSALLTLSFEYSRQLFVAAAIRDGLMLFAMEVMLYVMLGYLMGLKRIPANYMPLIIIKFFMVLEKQTEIDVKDFQVKVLQESRYRGQQYSVLTYKPTPATMPVETQVRNVALMTLSLFAMWTITKYTEIDMSKHERTALVCTTAGTSTAAMLLVTTFAFDTFPDFKAVHRRYCEVWVLLAFIVFAFMIMFLFQRLYKSVHGKLKPLQNMSMIWESAIYLFSFYVLLCYLPVIHRGLSVKTLLTNKTRLMEALVPSSIWGSGKVIAAYMYKIGEAIVTAHSGMMTPVEEQG